MASARKKVLVRRFRHDLLAGYLSPSNFISGKGSEARLDLLDLSGRVLPTPLSEIKYVAFVRDFNLSDRDPERLNRKTFLARPRNEGLWLRLTLRDEDLLEGLAPLDITLADGLLDDLGIQITPPDVRSNTQRLYIPRSSISAMEVVAVVTTPSKKKPEPKPTRTELQEDLFTRELPPNSRPN